MEIAKLARLLPLVVLLASGSPARAADPPCSSNAVEQAKKLLAFHAGPDDRIEIDKTVKQMPAVRNPEAPNQKFNVLEVWGYIYKAKYRMRLIYYNSPTTQCLLMGQEILEFARL